MDWWRARARSGAVVQIVNLLFGVEHYSVEFLYMLIIVVILRVVHHRVGERDLMTASRLAPDRRVVLGLAYVLASWCALQLHDSNACEL